MEKDTGTWLCAARRDDRLCVFQGRGYGTGDVLDPADVYRTEGGPGAGLHASCTIPADAGASLILLAVCMMNLAGGTYNPFIYFRF